MSFNKQNNDGNVLFLILIAVSLFAALSFVATRTGRNSGDTLSEEKASLLAGEIISYAAQIEQSVSRMRLINNVPEYGFDFSAGNHSISATNTTCTSNNCKLFNTEGGNISPKPLPKAAWDYNNANMTSTWRGRMYFRVVAVQDIGTDAHDLMLMYPGINKKTCAAINDLVNVPNSADGSPPTDSNGVSGVNQINYSGPLTTFPEPSSSAIALGDEATQFAGKRTFCAAQSSGTFYFWHVVLAR